MRTWMKKLAAILFAVTVIMTAVSAGAENTRKLDTYYSLAVQYINRENYDKALEYLFAALEYCDEETSKNICADLHLKIACVRTLQQDYENALKELEETLRISPDLAEAWLVQTQVYSETEQYQEAARSLEKYIELSGDRESLETLYQLYSQAGDTENALRCYQAWLDASDLEDAQKVYEMASYKMESGLYTEAIADLETIRNDAEYGKAAAYRIGVCHMQAGDYAQAVEAFGQCADFAAELDGIRYNTGVCYMQMEMYAEAIEAFGASYETESFRNDAIYNRGICHLSQYGTETDEAAAEAALRAALADFTEYLALTAEEAKAAAAEGEEVPEAVNIATYYRAACYASLGEYDPAIADYTACIEADVSVEDSLFNRGLVQLQAGRMEEAREDLTSCIENGSHTDEALYYRSAVLDQLGEIQAAIDDLTACIEHGFSLGECYYQRAQLYQKLGDMDHYMEDLEASLNY